MVLFDVEHRTYSTVGWAEHSDAQHLDESQSLGFATLSANLQNFNMRDHPNYAGWPCLDENVPLGR
jgi:hypothetical protein